MKDLNNIGIGVSVPFVHPDVDQQENDQTIRDLIDQIVAQHSVDAVDREALKARGAVYGIRVNVFCTIPTKYETDIEVVQAHTTLLRSLATAAEALDGYGFAVLSLTPTQGDMLDALEEGEFTGDNRGRRYTCGFCINASKRTPELDADLRSEDPSEMLPAYYLWTIDLVREKEEALREILTRAGLQVEQ